MNLTMVGTGYVGLVTGALFAKYGNKVYCVDIDEEKINSLKKGKIPIYEPGLEDIVKTTVDEGRLHFTTNLSEAVKDSKVIFIAVGTPSSDIGAFDLKYVEQVAKDLGTIFRDCDDYKVVVDKSTVPPETAKLVEHNINKSLEGSNSSCTFDVVSNPEFLKEGKAVKDFEYPDRVVVGTDSEAAKKVMEELYHPFSLKKGKLIMMKRINAELVKLGANSFLATRISFMNQMAQICDLFGGDIMEVREGMCSDSRIGWEFMYPSVGYGGSCFPKDVQGLAYAASQKGFDPTLVREVHEFNETHKFYLAKKVEEHHGSNGGLKDKTFAVWGLAFKPQTDDMRESAAISIINYLTDRGAKVKAHDPKATDNAKKIMGDKDGRLEYCNSKYDCCKNADGLILVTEWSSYRAPDFHEIKDLMRTPCVFDGRNIYDPARVKELGFHYQGIGRR
ncbi:UDP-glucose/GDP-mannose dehydrogenase family protein [Candidatus Woesearchaeota archaeon]|nr:UDP-glucose/GDP-mannose dehydrogenase family protein [Candidatus Woesearchaeota archaeon]MBT7367620.1 UDP-glucose/GDP-mannose dehydrogenase family protein [Candidatus Woesearchaeota archaeon]